ncbi:MAG: tetratricopeptide repeat protein, partial [Caldilineaceae bacterium]|nr:tetratricopeptide repeat protein [Caldilineaceae bacterium]
PVRRAFAALDDVWLTELARLLPELLAERTSLPAPVPLQEAWQQRRFHESIVRAILAAGEPLLIHFDDLQWCDAETLSWLRFLLRTQPQARLLVVGTVRTEELDTGHPLHALRLDLQRRSAGSDIELGPLAHAEIGELAAAVAGHELPASTVAQLQIEAEGSPLFAVEIMRAHTDGESLLTRPRQIGVIPGAANLPPKVQAVIQARLAQISPPARELVAMAAVVGRQFTYGLLAEISEFGDDELVTRLDELWRRRIVRAQGVDAYDFSHDRIRDTAYLAVSPMVRRRLHEKTAHALETIHAQHLDEVSGRVAEHYAAAGRAADAAHYFLQAGDFATGQFARNEALRYYNRALELNPSMERNDCWRAHLGRLAIYEATGNAEAQGQQLRLLDELVSYWKRDGLSGTKLAHHQATVHIHRQTFAAQCGEQDASEAHGRWAVESATQASDHVLEAQAYLAWGDAVWRTSDFGAALGRFEIALEKAEAADAPALKAEALELLSQTGMFSGASHAQMMAQMRSALINYDAAGDLLGRCRILNKLGYVAVAHGMDDYEESMAHYQAALDLCRQIGRKYLESTILRNIGILFCCTGRYAQAFTSLRQSLAVAKRGEHEFHRTVAINYLGYLHFQSGNLNAAARAQLTALRSLRTQENHHFVIKALTNLGQIYHARAENHRALDALQEARRLSAELGERRQESYAATAMGHLLLQQGDVNEAVEAYRFALTQHDKLEQANRALEPRAGLADVALQQGEPAVAQSHVETILEHLQTHRLDLTDEALRVYLTCHRVLSAAADARAARLLQQAVDQLH